MMRKAMALALLILITGFTLVWLIPTGTGKGQTIITPTVTLPACQEEDGSGHALCMWDADVQGNGMGTDAVSGECAVGSNGIPTGYTSALCVKLWERNAHTMQYQGATIEIADGPVLVEQCIIESENGNALECIKAELNS
jgi:hypothetical protein